METVMEAIQLMENKQTDKALELLENYLPLSNDEEKYTIAELYMNWGFLQEARGILTQLFKCIQMKIT